MTGMKKQRVSLLATAMIVALAAAFPTRAFSSEEYIKKSMDISFSMDEGFWDAGIPSRGDYFWMFSQMTFDYFAVSRDCNIDAFMVLETNKKGSVAAYTTSEKDFMAENGVQAASGFESWGGRIVGYVLSSGPGSKIGTMRSRANAMGNTIYQNKTYMIVNNGNLLTFVISAPKESWSGSCGKGIDKMLASFQIHGEPDPREKGIASYQERSTGSSLPTASENRHGSGGSSSSGLPDGAEKQIRTVRRLADEALEASESDDVNSKLNKILDILDELLGNAGGDKE